MNILKSRRKLTAFIFISLGLLYLHNIALTQTVSWETFLRVNSPLFIFLQIILSAINAFLGAYSIILIFGILKNRRAENKLNFLQSIGALVFSILTTGCYVCGNLLLPVIGLAGSFGALPFAGLEVKTLTALFLVYSIFQLRKSYQGICEVESKRIYKLNFDKFSFILKVKYLQRVRPLLITSMFILLIYILPGILPFNSGLVNSMAGTSCTDQSCICNSHS
jgi:hypothetical protein